MNLRSRCRYGTRLFYKLAIVGLSTLVTFGSAHAQYTGTTASKSASPSATASSSPSTTVTTVSTTTTTTKPECIEDRSPSGYLNSCSTGSCTTSCDRLRDRGVSDERASNAYYCGCRRAPCNSNCEDQGCSQTGGKKCVKVLGKCLGCLSKGKKIPIVGIGIAGADDGSGDGGDDNDENYEWLDDDGNVVYPAS